MKLLHSADWHLDSPLVGYEESHAQYLRSELLKIPDKVVSLCKSEGCDLLLLSGDLFDKEYSKESFHAVVSALEDVSIPVFISPGNHDYCSPDSPYLKEVWPENVHIFTRPAIESVLLPELDCRIYGAGYDAMDCPGLLKGFHAQDDAKWQIGILHGDPLLPTSPYCPISSTQIKESGLDYLALGHIHKGDTFWVGNTLCAWPGCPMGRAFDETGIKGLLLVEFEETVTHQFLPLNTPRFFEEVVEVSEDLAESLETLLPPVNTQDFYRITLTGYSAPLDLSGLKTQFPHVPNLEFRDRTLPELDLWSNIHEDTLEGLYFKILHDGMNTESEKLQNQLKLAAKISRQILDGQEVILP